MVITSAYFSGLWVDRDCELCRVRGYPRVILSDYILPPRVIGTDSGHLTTARTTIVSLSGSRSCGAVSVRGGSLTADSLSAAIVLAGNSFFRLTTAASSFANSASTDSGSTSVTFKGGSRTLYCLSQVCTSFRATSSFRADFVPSRSAKLGSSCVGVAVTSVSTAFSTTPGQHHFAD